MAVQVNPANPAENDYLLYDKTQLDKTFCMKWARFDLLNISDRSGIKEVWKEIEQMIKNKRKNALYWVTASTTILICTSINLAFKFAWTQSIYKKFHINNSNLVNGCLAAASVSALLWGLWKVQPSKIEADVISICANKQWKYYKHAKLIWRWINAANKRMAEITELKNRCDRHLELLENLSQRESLTFTKKDIRTAFDQSCKTTEITKEIPSRVYNVIKLAYQNSGKKQKTSSHK